MIRASIRGGMGVFLIGPTAIRFITSAESSDIDEPDRAQRPTADAGWATRGKPGVPTIINCRMTIRICRFAAMECRRRR
jgi:hypothetical protein